MSLHYLMELPDPGCYSEVVATDSDEAWTALHELMRHCSFDAEDVSDRCAEYKHALRYLIKPDDCYTDINEIFVTFPEAVIVWELFHNFSFGYKHCLYHNESGSRSCDFVFNSYYVPWRKKYLLFDLLEGSFKEPKLYRFFESDTMFYIPERCQVHTFLTNRAKYMYSNAIGNCRNLIRTTPVVLRAIHGNTDRLWEDLAYFLPPPDDIDQWDEDRQRDWCMKNWGTIDCAHDYHDVYLDCYVCDSYLNTTDFFTSEPILPYVKALCKAFPKEKLVFNCSNRYSFDTSHKFQYTKEGWFLQACNKNGRLVIKRDYSFRDVNDYVEIRERRSGLLAGLKTAHVDFKNLRHDAKSYIKWLFDHEKGAKFPSRRKDDDLPF